jgi:hypothetical protein
MRESLEIYSIQLDRDIVDTHRKEQDAKVKFEEDKLSIIKQVSKNKAEMNTMYKEKSSLRSQFVEKTQKFNEDKFYLEGQLQIQNSIMARAHLGNHFGLLLGMKTFEDQIIRIK